MENVKGIRSWEPLSCYCEYRQNVLDKQCFDNGATRIFFRLNTYRHLMIYFVEGRQYWVFLLPETWIVEEGGI